MHFTSNKCSCGRKLASSTTFIRTKRHRVPLQHINPFTQQRSSRRGGVTTRAVVQPTELSAADPSSTIHTITSQIALLADVPTADPAGSAVQKSVDLLTPIADGLEAVLTFLQSNLEKVHVPYSYGWSIILLTVFVKLLTYPFTKTQVESSLAMQNLKPTIDAIKARYGDDKDRVQKETTALYEKAGVNPLAGCLPTLATIPVFWGLFRTLTNVAGEGLLVDGFYWIPSLAGPTTITARQSGTGTAWLYPFVDGAPPIGWDEATAYLILPVASVIAQYISSAIISPPVDPNDENAKRTKVILGFLPLMVGWFALNVPSGLGLYYLSNTVLTTSQQVFLKKLGGAKVGEFNLGPIDVGKARRNGEIATTLEMPQFLEATAKGELTAAAQPDMYERNDALPMLAMEEPLDPTRISFRCKRLRSTAAEEVSTQDKTAATVG